MCQQALGILLSVRVPRCGRRVSLGVAVAVFAGTSFLPPVSARPLVGWSQVQGGPQHRGFAGHETLVDAGTVSQLQEKWRVPLPPTFHAPSNGTVVVAAGTVYVAAGDVGAFDAVTGAPRWRVDIGGLVLGTPAIIGNLLVVGVEHRGVLALDALTGATVWERRLRTYDVSSVTVSAEQVFVTVPGTLIALRLGTGRVMWSATPPGCNLSSPTRTHDLVIVGGGGTDVSAYDAATGQLRWTQSFGDGCGLSYENWLPAVRDSTVYAGLLQGVAALDLATGTRIWFNSTDISGVFFPMAVTWGTVFAGQDGGQSMVALDRSDGSLRWRRNLDGQAAGFAVFGDLVWVTRSSGFPAGEVEAYLHRTGRRVFSRDLGPVSSGMPPVVQDGRVYVALGPDLVALSLS